MSAAEKLEAPHSRGVIFGGFSVRQMLAGLKTMTRRTSGLEAFTARGQATHMETVRGRLGCWFSDSIADDPVPIFVKCPYARRVGDRIWVRESWRTWERPADGVDGVLFGADSAFQAIKPTEAAASAWIVANDNGKHGKSWRSPLFMRRWMARLELEVLEIKVERVQSISPADAIAEGITMFSPIEFRWERDHPAAFDSAREAYLAGFDAVNGAGAAAVNPWVRDIQGGELNARTHTLATLDLGDLPRRPASQADREPRLGAPAVGHGADHRAARRQDLRPRAHGRQEFCGRASAAGECEPSSTAELDSAPRPARE